MSLTPSLPEDAALLDSLCANELHQFEQWFTELNAENAQRENAYYSGQPLEQATGIKPWFDAFVDGLTPTEALDADLNSSSS